MNSFDKIYQLGQLRNCPSSVPVWSKYSTGRFSARSRMLYGHHAKEKMGAVVGLCNGSGKPAVAAAKRIPGGRGPNLAIIPSRPSEAGYESDPGRARCARYRDAGAVPPQ